MFPISRGGPEAFKFPLRYGTSILPALFDAVPTIMAYEQTPLHAPKLSKYAEKRPRIL